MTPRLLAASSDQSAHGSSPVALTADWVRAAQWRIGQVRSVGRCSFGPLTSSLVVHQHGPSMTTSRSLIAATGTAEVRARPDRATLLVGVRATSSASAAE